MSVKRGIALVALMLVTACGRPATESTQGQHLEVLAVWTGAEQANFARVLDGFAKRTGASVTYTAAPDGVPGALTARLAAGRLPDVALLPQPGLLREYARRGLLVPLDRIAGDLSTRNFSPRWRALASSDGHLFGVWFKAANKSLVWYNVGAFERVGVVPPTNLDGLVNVAETLSARGTPAFSVGGKDAWTLTDWFENLYLRLAGPARYDQLAAHQIPWTDPTVVQTLRMLSTLLAPNLLAGGVAGAQTTTFPASVGRVVTAPPEAAMTAEGDFVAGAIPPETHAVVGVDADVFPFPASNDSGPSVEVGGDVAVLFHQSAAGDALMRYLATPEAAALWAARGGFISPNVNLDLAVYPDPISRRMARSVLEAGDSLRFDLSDLQPPAFGANPKTGMGVLLRDFLLTPDPQRTAARLEQAAAAAFAA